MEALTPTRERVTWVRWDKARMRNVTSHPWVWTVREPDGYERSFDTKREALTWIADYRAEQDYAAEQDPHRGHYSRVGGTWYCDTCDSPYCELA